ncbi:heparinase II/III domain-containing protein [Arthrobacter sp. NIO-1057]|uniref:heparinase II/III domain-containing protein n=1 Tax=Arthrobacter sp. NIO-1057 TaxID=993071 RepID=UPI00071CCF89|nr:heparinase II/III family protein [Arthrobacter sp. NIO-1057]KSU67694.1 hypothetical protein AS038_00885 [Arthrobacter sp. NIO-1057]SCB76208.1 Heparinase II/III-like protein [Arthrobacter sp. NIO-1057]
MEFVPSDNDRQLLAAYAGQFSDGTPRGWEFKELSEGWEITLPNTAKLLTSELINLSIWAEVPAKDANTTTLWRNSLAYLPRILQIQSGTQEVLLAEKIVNSFLDWIESATADDIGKLKSGSQDHQSALRIRTLLWILSFLFRQEREEEFNRFLTLYVRLLSVENRLLDELSLFQPNNHGIMLGIAHLHAETLLPALASGRANAHEWVKRLYSTLGEIIDEDGIASENTPIYQVFYVMLLEDIVSFVKWAGKFSGQARMFELLLRAAQIGVRKQLLPNGAVPPLGDSPGGMQYRFKPMLGSLWSPNNGLAVISRDEEYLSFVAGFRSVIHKQLDDLSIAWWRDGDFIFRDAGLLSYDQNDPIAVAMRGPQGHSLPTYSQFDTWTTKNSISYGKNSSRLRGRLLERSLLDDKSRLTAELTYDDKPILKRQVSLSESGELIVMDSFIATRYGEPKVRFLLDPSIRVVKINETNLRLSRNDFQADARFESSDSNLKISVNIGESYVALEHHKVAKTSEIILSAPNVNGTLELTSIFKISQSSRSNK